MNEQDIRGIIKIGGKKPSPDFTDNVMGEISSLRNEVPAGNKWIFKVLLFACCLLCILSIFISIPEIQFLNYSIGFSPVIMPIISLIFIFIVLQQLYDIRNIITNDKQNNVVQQL